MQLTNKNYYSKDANMHYMSASQIKDFLKCPACAIAKIKGEWDTDKSDALLIGGYVDAYFSDELDDFIKENQTDLFKSPNKLYAKFEVCKQIIDVIKADAYLMEFFIKGITQVIETGVIKGVPVKAKYDALFNDYIVDWKCMKDFKDVWHYGKYKPFWYVWGYDLQLALYQEINLQNSSSLKTMYISGLSKESITDKKLLRFKQETLDAGMTIINDNIVTFDDMKKGKIQPTKCGTCDYCKSIKKLAASDIEEV